jgi:uncharacterized protein
MAGEGQLQQYGVIAYRRDPVGRLSILLITSRQTRRWVVPRGNMMTSLSPAEAAAQEAWEEAGIVGLVSDDPVGSYDYLKRKKDGSAVRASVELYPFRVAEQKAEWPEKGQRETRWFDQAEAAAVVEEPGLSSLISSFAP